MPLDKGGDIMNNSDRYKKKLAKERDIKFFFGDVLKITNEYFEFIRYKDDNNIVILTNNIKTIKGSFVLVVDIDKAVYLKDWQVRQVYNYFHDITCYAVKLNRQYFKPYQFSFEFDGFGFEKEDTFDDLVEVAKEQDKENMKIKLI